MLDTTLSCHTDGLFGYAMVLSRNPTEAADLVQETYVRALKAQKNLRPSSNVKSWLFTILRNIWLNQLRHERNAPEIPPDKNTPEERSPVRAKVERLFTQGA